jgi:hypothetical protein
MFLGVPKPNLGTLLALEFRTHTVYIMPESIDHILPDWMLKLIQNNRTIVAKPHPRIF